MKIVNIYLNMRLRGLDYNNFVLEKVYGESNFKVRFDLWPFLQGQMVILKVKLV